MHLKLVNLLLLSSLFVVSCSLQPPKPDVCILDFPASHCIPTNKNKSDYEKDTDEMILQGYLCVSPDDYADIKKFVKHSLSELDQKFSPLTQSEPSP